jgi:hypothetical protein
MAKKTIGRSLTERMKRDEFREGFNYAVVAINIANQIEAHLQKKGIGIHELATQIDVPLMKLLKIQSYDIDDVDLEILYKIGKYFDCAVTVQFKTRAEVVHLNDMLTPGFEEEAKQVQEQINREENLSDEEKDLRQRLASEMIPVPFIMLNRLLVAAGEPSFLRLREMSATAHLPRDPAKLNPLQELVIYHNHHLNHVKADLANQKA